MSHCDLLIPVVARGRAVLAYDPPLDPTNFKLVDGDELRL